MLDKVWLVWNAISQLAMADRTTTKEAIPMAIRRNKSILVNGRNRRGPTQPGHRLRYLHRLLYRLLHQVREESKTRYEMAELNVMRDIHP